MIKTKIGRAAGFAVAIIAALSFTAGLSAPTPAQARVFVGFGFGFPIGFPFYYPPYPYPYYPPPPPPYYPAPASYPAPGPSSQSSGIYEPSGIYAPSGSAGSPSITYTPRRGWTNAQGEYCREYRTTQPTGNRATERYGTACRDAGGPWRIVN